MFKRIDKIIAIWIVVYLFCILFNKFIAAATIVFCLLLIIRVIRDKRIVPIVLITVLIGLLFYNYYISMEYFNLNLSVLSSKSNMEYLIRMLTFTMMLYCFSDREILIDIYSWIREYINWVIYITIAYEFIIGFLLITGKGFIYRWGMNVFVGLNGSPHGNAYLMILIGVIIEWIALEKGNKYLYLYIIPFITVFASGARTPTIVMGILFLGIRLFKNRILINKSLRISWKFLILVTCFLIFIVIYGEGVFDFILNSTVMDKLVATSESGNILNSRDVIWGGLLKEFRYNFSDFQRFFGHGIHYSVVINLYNVYSPIWGHSDFIDILISYGGLVLAIYVLVYLRYFIKLYTLERNLLLEFIFFVAMILLSIFNGVINYTVFISIVVFWAIFYISINKSILGELDNE